MAASKSGGKSDQAKEEFTAIFPDRDETITTGPLLSKSEPRAVIFLLIIACSLNVLIDGIVRNDGSGTFTPTKFQGVSSTSVSTQMCSFFISSSGSQMLSAENLRFSSTSAAQRT
jgi:hypothetical protein